MERDMRIINAQEVAESLMPRAPVAWRRLISEALEAITARDEADAHRPFLMATDLCDELLLTPGNDELVEELSAQIFTIRIWPSAYSASRVQGYLLRKAPGYTRTVA